MDILNKVHCTNDISDFANDKPRIRVLDSLRGIAALAVVLFHYSIAYSPSDILIKFKYGYLGVHLFFIISGFVIYMTLEKTKKPFDFIISRFSRLFPAYWAAVLLTTILMKLLARSDDYVSGFQLIGNLTMFQHWLRIKDIDGAYWTLAVELSFYAFMFILFISKGIKYLYPISVILILCFILIKTLRIPFVGNVFPFLMYTSLFISGMFFYKIRNKENVMRYHILILVSILVQVIFSNSIIEGVYILLIFLVFYLFTFNWLEFLNNKIILFFGSISYSLYLIHENIGILILNYLEHFQLSYIFRLSSVLIIVIFLAFLITKFIEKPAMNLIRNKFRK